MCRLFIGILVLETLFFCTISHAGEEKGISDYRTDLEMVKETLWGSSVRGLEGSPLSTGVSVSLHSMKEDERDWILMDVLTEVLLDRGYNVTANITDSLSVGNGDYSLYFRIADIKLSYRPRSFLKLFKKSVERDVQADVLLRLSDNSDGAVVWTKWVKGRDKDLIPNKYNKLLGDEESIERHMIEKEGKFVEALVALGVISSIVLVAFR